MVIMVLGEIVETVGIDIVIFSGGDTQLVVVLAVMLSVVEQGVDVGERVVCSVE